jgi:hypothetical protein
MKRSSGIPSLGLFRGLGFCDRCDLRGSRRDGRPSFSSKSSRIIHQQETAIGGAYRPTLSGVDPIRTQLLVSRDGRFQHLVGFRRVDESLYEHTPVFVAITADWTSLRTKSVTEISMRLAPRPIFRFRSGVWVLILRETNASRSGQSRKDRESFRAAWRVLVPSTTLRHS